MFVVAEPTLLVGPNRWSSCKVVRTAPMFASSLSYVTLSFQKNPYGKDDQDRITIEGNSKRAVREFAAYVSGWYGHDVANVRVDVDDDMTVQDTMDEPSILDNQSSTQSTAAYVSALSQPLLEVISEHPDHEQEVEDLTHKFEACDFARSSRSSSIATIGE